MIRSKDIERAVTFYESIGLSFEKHSHGAGPEHYACQLGGFVFEIYPLSSKMGQTVSTRISFSVGRIDSLVERLDQIGASVASSPADSEWGRRAVVTDFDGLSVELLEPTEEEN